MLAAHDVVDLEREAGVIFVDGRADLLFRLRFESSRSHVVSSYASVLSGNPGRQAGFLFVEAGFSRALAGHFLKQSRIDRAGPRGARLKPASTKTGPAFLDAPLGINLCLRHQRTMRDDGFIEREARLGTMPSHELVDGMSIAALRLGRTQAVKLCRFSLMRIRQPELHFRSTGLLSLGF